MQPLPPVRPLRPCPWLLAFAAAILMLVPRTGLAQTHNYSLVEQYGNATISELDTSIQTPGSSNWNSADTGHIAMCAYLSLCLENNPAPGSAPTSTAITQAGYDLTQLLQSYKTSGAFTSSLGGSADASSDNNAVQFETKGLVDIYKQYYNSLDNVTPNYAQNTLNSLLVDASTFMYGQPVKSGYTNIYSMQFTNELLMGEILGSTNNGPTILNTGLANLDTFIDNTRSIGSFHEFDSPNYSETNYSNLVGAYLYTTHPLAKAKLGALLDYAAADLSANFFVGSLNLAGSHAREYQFASGRGEVRNFFYLEGLTNQMDSQSYSDGYYEYVTLKNGGYSPPAYITAIPTWQADSDVVVKQTWGSDGAEDRYTFLTAGYSLGSSGGEYNESATCVYDKQISASLTPSTQAPLTVNQTEVVYDQTDLPYGEHWDGGKPRHLNNVSATVQDKNVVFSLSDLAGVADTFAPDYYTTLASNVIFPLNVDTLYYGSVSAGISENSAPANISSTSVIDLGSTGNAVVAIRTGLNMVAFRLLYVDSIPDPVNGTTVYDAVLKFEGNASNADTYASGMGRLVTYNYYNKSNTTNFTIPPAARTALVMITDTLPSSTDPNVIDSNAKAFINAVLNTKLTGTTYSNNIWSSSVSYTEPFTTDPLTSGTTTLSASLNTSTAANYGTQKGSATLSRTVNTLPYVPSRFTVTRYPRNGSASTTIDFAQTILDPVITGASDLVATPSNASVSLTWSAVPGATAYNVYRSTTSGQWGTTPLTGSSPVSSTSYTDATAANGTTYYYVVTANKAGTSGNAATVGGYSNVTSAQPAPPPVAPTIQPPTTSDGSVSLTWNVPANAQSYTVYRATSSGGTYTQRSSSNFSGNSWTDNNLTDGTTYYYEVAATGVGGTSPNSQPVSATPQVLPPTNLMANAGDSSVSLSWTLSTSSSVNYVVYRSTSSGGTYSKANAGTITNNTWTDNSVTDGTTYYYQVVATNGPSTSAFSNNVNATPQVAPPTNPAATPSDGSVRVTWTPSPNTSATYVVYRSTSSGSGYAKASVNPISTSNWVDNSVTDGTTYYYEVAAVLGSNTSTFTSYAAATPQVAPPTSPMATATDGSVRVTWTLSPNTSATYVVYRSTSSGSGYTKASVNPISTNNWTDNSAVNGTTYYYEVEAVLGSSTSPFTTYVAATPQVLPPTGVTATAASKSVHLTWTLSTSSGVNYVVYRSTSSGGTYTKANAGTITTNNWSDNGQTPGTTYYYYLTAVNGPSTSAFSNIASATPTP